MVASKGFLFCLLPTFTVLYTSQSSKSFTTQIGPKAFLKQRYWPLFQLQVIANYSNCKLKLQITENQYDKQKTWYIMASIQ